MTQNSLSPSLSALSLKDQLKNLEHLQELDLKILNLCKKKDSLPALLSQLDQSIKTTRVALEGKNKEFAEIEKVFKQTQAAMELNQDRVQRTAKKLEDVQNTKEFQAATKETEQLKKFNETLETDKNKSQEHLKTLTTQRDGIQAELDKLMQEREKQWSLISTQESHLNSDLSTLNEERKKYTTGVQVQILGRYDRIRGAKAGLGIVPAIAGRCKGCNMMIPPQLFNEIQKLKEVYQCPSCHRILFIPQPGEAPARATEAQAVAVKEE